MSKIALSSQLIETACIIQQVTQGVSLDKALLQVDTALRPGVQSLSYHVLRYLGLGRVLVRKLVKKTPPQQVQVLLWCALVLCNGRDEEKYEEQPAHRVIDASPHYQAYIVVNEAVQAAKLHHKTRSFAPLVNGVLRSFLRNRENLMAEVCAAEQGKLMPYSLGALSLNFQPWWVERLQNDWTNHWKQILQTAQYPAPMALRVNVQQGTVMQAKLLFDSQSVAARIVGPYAIELDKAMAVESLPRFGQGYLSVQAVAAQLAAPLLLPVQWARQRVQGLGRPLRVLDACAAPGGKTAHILELAREIGVAIDVVALDVDAGRLERVRQTLERTGHSAELRVADAADPQAFSKNEAFDAILLDAPCTASGIVRRHPDIRWLRRETDVAKLASQQQRLLDALWLKLLHGGRLLYCTCSVFKAEGEESAQNFVMRHNKDIIRLSAPGHILPMAMYSENTADLNQLQMSATDGFYYALFEK